MVTAIFWQSPLQVQLAQDVIINDNTYNKVNCQYPLNTGVIVDGHNVSRNIWYCFHRSEDVETYTWVIQSYLGDQNAGDGIDEPEVFISDCDASLIASVGDALPKSFHVYCLYHQKDIFTTTSGYFLVWNGLILSATSRQHIA